MIGKLGLPESLEGEGSWESQKLITSARYGNLEEINKNWLREDRKLCDLCLVGEKGKEEKT